MKNDERLLSFIKERWEEAGRPSELPLSANQITKAWKIQKNKRTVTTTMVEVDTSRDFVCYLLKKLTNQGKITYETKEKRHPVIKVL